MNSIIWLSPFALLPNDATAQRGGAIGGFGRGGVVPESGRNGFSQWRFCRLPFRGTFVNRGWDSLAVAPVCPRSRQAGSGA
jgi:hypothetical protein